MNRPTAIDHFREMRRIVRAVRVQSSTSYTIGDKEFEFAPAAQGQKAPGEAAKAAFLADAGSRLYSQCYVRRFDGAVHEPDDVPQEDSLLTAGLEAANCSTSRWYRGWHVAEVMNSGQIVAQNRSTKRDLWPGEFISEDGPGTPPRQGAAIRIFAAGGSASVQPGFYFAFGEQHYDAAGIQASVRFYWNTTPEGGSELVGTLTKRLNHLRIPFRMKCATRPSMFERLDNAVLYVDRSHADYTARALRDVHRDIRAHMGDGVPLFTHRLAVGLGFAEDPGQGESFGQSRSRMLAEGIWAAYEEGLTSEPDRIRRVQRRFEEHGIDIRKPYLRPSSVGGYDFPTFEEAA